MVPFDPRVAAEQAKAKELADALAPQKPEFDAARAANDEAKITATIHTSNDGCRHFVIGGALPCAHVAQPGSGSG
jgi:hypothetical protein